MKTGPVNETLQKLAHELDATLTINLTFKSTVEFYNLNRPKSRFKFGTRKMDLSYKFLVDLKLYACPNDFVLGPGELLRRRFCLTSSKKDLLRRKLISSLVWFGRQQMLHHKFMMEYKSIFCIAVVVVSQSAPAFFTNLSK